MGKEELNIDLMVCSKCGAKLNDDSFCNECSEYCE